MTTFATYAHLPVPIREAFAELEDMLGDLDGKTIATAADENTFIDEGTIVMDDAVNAFNTLVAALSLQDHGWRPISTAPKDWTAILLFNSRHPSHPPVVGRFATEPGEPHWCDAATLNGEALYFNSNYFDFWQPTPASPVILAEQETKS